MKPSYFLVLGYLVVNLSIWIVSTANILLGGVASTINPAEISSWFNLSIFAGIVGAVGGVVIGILALITKSYALSTGVLLLWVIGVLFKPISDIFVGLPYLINAFLPPDVWFVTQALVGLAAFCLFVFFVGIIAGRDIW